MARFSPKIEIINHFDNLINKVDIDIDNSIEYYNSEQFLRELLISTETYRKNFPNSYNKLKVAFYDTFNSSKNQHQSLDSWSNTTKVVDYLKQIRMTTIEKLRKAQEDTLEYYKLNSSKFKSEVNDEKNIDELKSQLFAEKYYFQVHVTQTKNQLWSFNIFTFVTDFYMSSSDIDTLENLINHEKKPFCLDAVFDEKTVLIALLYKFFAVNLLNFPNHIIHVCKQDVLNIKSIIVTNDFTRVSLSGSTIDLSKIDNFSLIHRDVSKCAESIEINIDGLSSLKSLYLGVYIDKTHFSTNFWSGFPSKTLQELDLYGNFSYFNFDNFVNLKRLSLDGTITESFNFELFKNLCNQLESLRITFTDIDFNTLFKLFDGCQFPYLQFLSISECFMERVDKHFINRFPLLRGLYMNECNLQTIEDEAFSNLKQLFHLGLSGNQIRFIGKNAVLNLNNLKVLNLSDNGLTHIDREYFGLGDSVVIYL